MKSKFTLHMTSLRIGKVFLFLGFAFFLGQNFYFGWNEEAMSDIESYADHFNQFLFFLGMVFYFSPVVDLYEGAVTNRDSEIKKRGARVDKMVGRLGEYVDRLMEKEIDINSNIAKIRMMSSCELHTYKVTRFWDSDKGTMAFVFADPVEIEIEKQAIICQKYADNLGYGGFDMCFLNSGVVSVKNSLDVSKDAEYHSKKNEEIINDSYIQSEMVILCWGGDVDESTVPIVLRDSSKTFALDINGNGKPCFVDAYNPQMNIRRVVI